jgi:hypothetical protein
MSLPPLFLSIPERASEALLASTQVQADACETILRYPGIAQRGFNRTLQRYVQAHDESVGSKRQDEHREKRQKRLECRSVQTIEAARGWY